ncbi:hypothetical protein [Pseudomonas brassicacearum]|uniref:hypothetical protein n=1 Tax=Pseudomonas brassicacearum TaxID=930166 RepID=UPI00138DD7AA|nr:hypothetical protein [Pseudomonas brassicacearum]
MKDVNAGAGNEERIDHLADLIQGRDYGLAKGSGDHEVGVFLVGGVKHRARLSVAFADHHND